METGAPFVSYDNSVSWRLRETVLKSRRQDIEYIEQENVPTKEVAAVVMEALSEADTLIASHNIHIPEIFDHLIDTLASSVFVQSGTKSDMLLKKANRIEASRLARNRLSNDTRLNLRERLACSLCFRPHATKMSVQCCGQVFCRSCTRVISRCSECGKSLTKRLTDWVVRSISKPPSSWPSHAFWLMRLSTFHQELLSERECLETEVKANPEVTKGINLLVSLQNRDQRVVARSTRNWMSAVRGFIFKRWKMAIVAQEEGRRRIISMLQKKKIPTAEDPFKAWKRLTQQSKALRINNDLAAICSLIEKTREKALEYLAFEREARESHFNMKQIMISLTKETKEAKKRLDAPETSGLALGSVIAALGRAHSVLGECCERQMNSAIDVTHVGSVLCKPRKELRTDLEFGRGMSADLRKTFLAYLPFSDRKIEENNAENNGASSSESSSEDDNDSALDDGDDDYEDFSGDEDGNTMEVVDELGEGTERLKENLSKTALYYRRERSENDPKYWPEDEPFPKKFDFEKSMLNDYWGWEMFRDKPVQALAYTTQTGGAVFEWAFHEASHLRDKIRRAKRDFRPSGSKSVTVQSKSEEDRAARMFQSIWRARAARIAWAQDKDAVLAAAIVERQENEAALKFQTAWRGRCARLEWKRDPKGVIKRKQEREAMAAALKKEMHMNMGLADALEYAVGGGDKAHGAPAVLAGESPQHTENTLLGTWRYLQMSNAGRQAVGQVNLASAQTKLPTDEIYTTEQLVQPPIQFSNFCTFGKHTGGGYLTSTAASLSLGKTGNHKSNIGLGKMPDRLAWRSGCQRESLRYAFLVETFERVAGKDDLKVVKDIVDRRANELKTFHRITEMDDFNLVKSKNRGRMPRRKEEEDKFLFRARLALSVVVAPPLGCFGELVHRMQAYDVHSLSDARWIATAQLLASCSSRMISHWKLSVPLLDGRAAGAAIHRHVAAKLGRDVWRFQSSILLQRSASGEEENEVTDAWIPETHKISDIFTSSKGPFEYDVDDIGLMEEQMRRLRHVVEQYIPLIKKVFVYYAAAEETIDDKSSSSTTINQSEFMAFVKEIKIMHRHKKRLKNSHLIKAFNMANKDEKADVRRASALHNSELSDDEEADENPNDELTKVEFCEVLIRIGAQVYRNKTSTKGEYGEPWPLSKMVETFLSEDVRPNACAPNRNAMADALKSPVAIHSLHDNRRILKRIFLKYAAADQSDSAAKTTGSINIEELRTMVRDANLVGPKLTDRMLAVLFLGAQGDESNGEEAEVSDDAEMDFEEFKEILAAFVSY